MAELVDATEIARQLGVSRDWVYAHATELGAIKMGAGPKPRLRFDPEVARANLFSLAPARIIPNLGFSPEGPSHDLDALPESWRKAVLRGRKPDD